LPKTPNDQQRIKVMRFLYITWPLIGACFVFLSANAHAITPWPSWKDSYSVDDQCYCDTTFDHAVGEIEVQTPAGPSTVAEVCALIGPGPGADGNPIYNDVQCGNGPANDAGDETSCPGRIDQGESGCMTIGPSWNLNRFYTEAIEQPEPIAVAEQPVVDESVTPGVSEGSVDAESTLDTFPPAGLLFEAEDVDTADDRWIFSTSQNAIEGSILDDSDASHAMGASGGAYMELLPEGLLDTSDNASADTVWPIPGDGPTLQFNIDFPVEGTYEVFARAFSSNVNADTIHVGVDGLWSADDSIIELCDQRDEWVWSDCNENKRTFINVPTSGMHTVHFAGRDDGYELDQFVLSLVDAADVGTTTVTPELSGAVRVGGGAPFAAASLNRWLLILIACTLGVRYLIRKRPISSAVKLC
jgi:hypothetical protein